MKNKSLILLVASLLFSIQCAGPQKRGETDAVSAEGRSGSLELHASFYEKAAEEVRGPAAARKKYQIGRATCGGYPALGMSLPPGFCVGLVYDGSEAFKMARTALPYKDTVFLVEMGPGWEDNVGALYRLDRRSDGWRPKKILAASDLVGKDKKLVDRLSGLMLGPDGMIYVGAAGTIWKFPPEAAMDAETLKPAIVRVIEGLPSVGLHPLKHFAFDANGSMYVNVGTITNVCDGDPGRDESPKICKEAETRAQILFFQRNENGSYGPAQTVAKGLRNSMALAVDPRSGILYQGENGRDSIEKADKRLNGNLLPHEELNRITKGANYGWPYCYDNGVASPEFKGWDCKKTTDPIALLPAHSAPLGMLFYNGKMFPPWYRGKMLLSLHGYKAPGHRLAVVDVSQAGKVVGKPYEFMGGWGESDKQPMGAPVSIVVADDGALWVTEDKNGTILRIVYDPKKGDGIPKRELKEDGSSAPVEDKEIVERRRKALEERLALPNPPTFSRFQTEIIDSSCIACHGGAQFPGVQLLKYDDLGNAQRLRDGGYVAGEDVEKSGLYGMLEKRVMPSGGYEGATDEAKEAKYNRALELLRKWIDEGAP